MWHGRREEKVSVRSMAAKILALPADSQPIGGGEALQKAFPRFVDDLVWWPEAARAGSLCCISAERFEPEPHHWPS